MSVVQQAFERLKSWGRRADDPPAPGTNSAKKKDPAMKTYKRVSVPTVLQMEAVECGAASLAKVLAHYGKLVPLEELRTACGVSRDGSKASNVVKAARKYGLIAKGYKKEPAALRFLKPPMIVHWNFNHFLVFEGFKKNRAYLNDPATGPRTVPEEEFDHSFTGVVLTFEPGPDFKPGGATRSMFQALKSRLKGFHVALIFIILAGLALVVPGLVIPTFSKVFVDDLLINGMRSWLRPLLIAMGVTAALYAALTWLQQTYLLRMETKLAMETSGKFFWHVLQLPMKFFAQRFGGEVGARVGINDRVAQLLSGQLATTALNIVVIVFFAALMMQYDVLLTLIVAATASLNVVALRYFSRKRVDLNQRMLQERGKMLGVAMGGLLTIETLKATGSESDFFQRWAGYHTKTISAHQRLGYYSNLLSSIPIVLLGVATALALGVGGLRIMDGHLSMGMLIAFQALMISFITPVNRMVDLGSTLQEVKGDMNRLDDVLRYDRDINLLSDGEISPNGALVETAAAPPVVTKLSGALELRNVTFGYSPLDPPFINNFNLSLQPGMRVALVGGSGCGKSTLARLVCGLFEPWEGAILFDGTPRREIPRGVMINSFAVVDQEIFLFEGSIRDNLTLWDPTVPEATLVRAGKDACIHDDITTRPDGYNSMIDEGGNNFSGGQRQRLEIARALVGNPSMLVLDEATSALDPATEKIIDDNLRRRGCTCLIVAHRLSTIRDCDEIIVLDKGRVVQRGTHDELSQIDGPYLHLIESE